jgi:hypothetical protein
MSNTIEILHHFSCKSCSGWWSIAAEQVMDPRYWHCPWCGQNDYYEVENGKSVMGRGVSPEKH